MPTVKNPLAVRKPPGKKKQVPVKPVSLGRTVATPPYSTPFHFWIS